MSTPHQFFPHSKVKIIDSESPYFGHEFMVVSPAEEEDSFLLCPMYGSLIDTTLFHMDQIEKIQD